MSTIPISVTEDQFDEYIRPLLSTAKRGFVCQIALVKVFTTFSTACTRAVSGRSYRLPRLEATPKKRD